MFHTRFVISAPVRSKSYDSLNSTGHEVIKKGERGH